MKLFLPVEMPITFLRRILILFSARTLHMVTWIILLYTFYKNIQSTNTHDPPSGSIRTPDSPFPSSIYIPVTKVELQRYIKTNEILLVTVQASKVILTRGAKSTQLSKRLPPAHKHLLFAVIGTWHVYRGTGNVETDTGQAIASHFQKAHISIPFISNSWQSIGESVRFYLLWGIKCIRKKRLVMSK